MDTLIDDCLVPILAHLPFTEQITNIPLTCSRWNNLLPRVHQQRTQLVLWNTEDCPPECRRVPRLFSHLPPEEALPYTDYLTHIFNDSDRIKMTTLNSDFAIQNKVLRASMGRQLGVSFPNLTDLSLVGVTLRPNTLSALLAHFRIKLRSLSLIRVGYIWDNETLEDAQILASVNQILAVIDSMASLTRLALQRISPNGYTQSDLATELATVLPNLVEFHLVEHEKNVLPILERLDENKLRHLSLGGTVWSDAGMLSRLVATKPALGQNLTHLTVGSFEYTSGEDIDDHSVETLERIVNAFPQLVYFNFFTKNALVNMLSYLGKLKQLVTLKLVSQDSWLFGDIYFLRSHRRLVKSVKSLTICGCNLDITDDFPFIRAFFPELERLYLDGASFYCTCKQVQDEDGESEEEDSASDEEETGKIRLPSKRPVGCFCKVHLIAQLASFKHLPKVASKYTVE